MAMEWIKKSSSSLGGGIGNDFKPSIDSHHGRNTEANNLKLDNLIDDSDINQEFSPSKLEILRLKTLKFMASSWFGHIYVNFFLIVSIFSCGQYIFQTYLTNEQQVFPLSLSLSPFLCLYLSSHSSPVSLSLSPSLSPSPALSHPMSSSPSISLPSSLCLPLTQSDDSIFAPL
jgi:hypothetical protein